METSENLSRILLVEDDPSIQMIARVSLESVGGFTVKICSSGSEALRDGPAFHPELILLDVMMPEMDGPATLKALREVPALQGTPVIFMTAKVQPQEVAHYRSLGAVEVITKPFDPMGLSNRVREIWGRGKTPPVPS